MLSLCFGELGVYANAAAVLKPIETKNLTTADVEDLTRDTRDAMLKTMVDLTAQQRGRPVEVDAKHGVDGVVKASGVEATTSSMS